MVISWSPLWIVQKFWASLNENWNIKVATIDVTDEYSGESSIPPSEPKGKKKGKKKKKADAVSYFVFHKLKKKTKLIFLILLVTT